MSEHFHINEIKIFENGKYLSLHKAYHTPDLLSESILTKNIWEYVRHFFNQKIKERKLSDRDFTYIEEAIYFWDQAENLFELSQLANNITKPLLLYYFFLNATKSLLVFNNSLYPEESKSKNISHGIRQLTSSEKLHEEISKNTSYSPEELKAFYNSHSNVDSTLSKEIFVVFTQQIGVLTQLYKHMMNIEDNELELPKLYNLEDLISNLVFVHRAYSANKNIDIPDQLFIPLTKSFFVEELKNEQKMLSYYFETDSKFDFLTSYSNNEFKNIDNDFYIRSSNLKYEKSSTHTLNINNDHIKFIKSIRNDHQYIAGIKNRWYLKNPCTKKITDLKLHPLVILFSIFHCLSEFSRYNPFKLKNMLDSSKSEEAWLYNELISEAGFQFLDLITSEITGKELKIPRSF